MDGLLLSSDSAAEYSDWMGFKLNRPATLHHTYVQLSSTPKTFHLPKCCPVSHKLNLFCTSICDRDIFCGRLKVILTVKGPNVILALCLLQLRQTKKHSLHLYRHTLHMCMPVHHTKSAKVSSPLLLVKLLLLKLVPLSDTRAPGKGPPSASTT